MAFSKLWVIAYRDLGRNRRRSILSGIAVALGLGLLILMNGYIAGVMEESLQNDIRLRTGHVQIRAATYEEEKVSLQWADLLDDPEGLAARARALPGVKAAAPVLWASAILNTIDDSAGLSLYGVDVTSALYEPIRGAMVAGEFLQADDRGGIVIGQRLAQTMGIVLGQEVNLTVINADGQPDEANFTVRGLFATGIPGYDESAVFMPLARAQAFTVTDGHASAIVIMLNRQSDADGVAAALADPGITTLTWRDINQVLLQLAEVSMSFYLVMDIIVMLVVAVVIANTLLMAVFERIREMGILAALGMKGRQIMLMFLLEAATLGIAGIVAGVALGLAGVAYLATVGIYIGEIASSAGGIAISSTIHARFVPATFASLAFWTLVVILLASLYPAWFAIRREPAEALRAV
ncbi:MAG: ABC transporter permease [Caldilineaceae bacterium]|nr:ABC transporter permease [Caldilineaceae bacterium]